MLRRLSVLFLLVLLPQVGAARVYMCVDPQTGNTSFTDKACAKAAPGEEVRVDGANYSSGRHNQAASTGPRVWNSHRDERKTGRDYNDQRRRLYQEKATAGAGSAAP